MDLKEFVQRLDAKGMLIKIDKPMEVKFEIPTVMKKLDGRPILFSNVKGYDLPVVANVCSSRELVAVGLEVQTNEVMQVLAKAIDSPKEPELIDASGYHEFEGTLDDLPILTYYPFDGGPYIASAIVIVSDPELGINASYHRMMKLDKDKLVLRILQRHFNEFLSRGNTEFAFCIGNSIAMLVGAAVSAELGKSEIAIANALNKTNVVNLDGHIVPEAEIVIIAEMTGDQHSEGPFLDLTETLDIKRKQRVARVKKIYCRNAPMFHGLLPGGLEHKILMGMPREPTIYREVSKVCEVKDVLVTPGGASWLHGAVSIRKKAPEDAEKAIHAAFKGHTSMKHVFIVDDDINIHDPNEIEWAMATRFQGDRGLVILPKQKGSSLDPSSNLETRETTKIGFDLTIPSNRDPKDFRKPELPMDVNVDEYMTCD
ncbi:UbiD family decarboxylase [[Eubacterium] cellulosolvens]